MDKQLLSMKLFIHILILLLIEHTVIGLANADTLTTTYQDHAVIVGIKREFYLRKK
jgi:hypothetical protein